MRVLKGVVYMMKGTGPRTEPWGTPQEEVYKGRKVIFTFDKEAAPPHPLQDFKALYKCCIIIIMINRT